MFIERLGIIIAELFLTRKLKMRNIGQPFLNISAMPSTPKKKIKTRVRIEDMRNL